MYGRLPLKVPVTLLYPTSVLPTNAYWEAVCICQMGYVSLEALASHLHPDLCTPAQSAKPLGKGVGVENAQAFLESSYRGGGASPTVTSVPPWTREGTAVSVPLLELGLEGPEHRCEAGGGD